jgi:hypothetical protein
VSLYKKLGSAIQDTYNRKVKKDTFGVILCSLQASRRFTEDRITQFNNLIELLDPNDGFDRRINENIRKIQKSSAPTKMAFFAKYLLTSFPFFRRLDKADQASSIDFTEKYVKHFDVKEFVKDQLIMIPQDVVCIILNGKVILRDHTLENPSDYKEISVAGQGTILGAPDFDKG